MNSTTAPASPNAELANSNPASSNSANPDSANTAPVQMDLASIGMLSIDGNMLSLDQILRYHQLSGKLVPWLRTVIEQHVIFQGIQSQADIDVSLGEIEQQILDFRIAQNLQDREPFEAWLAQESLNLELLKMRVLMDIKLSKFKGKLAATNLESLFALEKPLLDGVEATLVGITSETVAAAIKQKIELNPTEFETIVQEYATAAPEQLSVMKNTIRMGQLPETARLQVQAAQAGDILGPLEIEGRFCILRIEAFQPAVLEGNLKQNLEEQLFQQWVSESVQKLSVEFTPGIVCNS